MIGSLSNDDINENGKKAVVLDWQSNSLFCTFFSLLSVHDYNVKMPNFTFFGKREHKTTNLNFSFPEFRYSFLELNSRKNF